MLSVIVGMEGRRRYVLERIETDMVKFSQSICDHPCESKGVVLARIKSCLEKSQNKNNILGLKTEPLKVIVEKLRSFVDVEGGVVNIPRSGSHTHLSPLSAQLAFRDIIDFIDGYSQAAIKLACVLDGECCPWYCDEHDVDGEESSDC